MTTPNISLIATSVDSGITINFDTYYDKDISEYCHFPMARKRNFVSMIDSCVANLNLVLDHSDFAIKLLSLKFDISLLEGDDNFVDDNLLPSRIADLFDDEIVACIRAKTAEEYAKNEININTENGSKNFELQFTNDHAKTILEWSFACVIAAPIITAYMSEKDIQSKESGSLIMNCFGQILKKFEPADTNILVKLRKLVESRVLQTRYSDKVIWTYLRNIALEPELYIDKLFRRFVNDAIPKLYHGSNIIGFFHTFLKNQIKYQFTAKFAFAFKPIKPDVSDTETVSAMEHLMTELIRQDEGSILIGEIACNDAVNDLAAELNWYPSNEIIDHWAAMFQKYGINSWQRSMVIKFFLPKVRQIQFIRSRTLREYTVMQLLLMQWLETRELHVIKAYLGARIIEVMDGRRILTRKKFIGDLMDSMLYRELLGTHYPLTIQPIVESDVLLKMISIVHIGSFERIPATPEEIEIKQDRILFPIEAIAQELLCFIHQITI